MIAISQPNNTDSLKRLLAQTSADTNRATLLRHLASSYRFFNTDTAIILAQQALLLSRKLNFTSGEVRALNTFGEILRIQGEYPKALEMLFDALRLSKNSHDREAEAIGMVYISSVYTELSEFRQGQLYLLQALKINEYPKNMNTLILSNIGSNYEKMNQLDSAFIYQLQASAMLKELPTGTLKSLVLMRLGIIQARFGNNAGALHYYNDALQNAYITGDLLNQGRVQYRIAEHYYQFLQPDSSLAYARLAFITCQLVSQKLTQMYASNLLVKLYQEQNNLDSAFYYQQASTVIKDSLFSPEKFQRLQLLTSIEQQRQQEILRAQADFKNKMRLYGLLAALGVFLLLATILYRNNRQKQKANALLHYQKSEIQNTLAELRATQSQLIQTEKMASLGELTAGIAHEIQNPLNFVNNFSDVNKELLAELDAEIEKGNYDDAKAIAKEITDNHEKINHHGKRADSIVKGMLQHARTSRGHKEPADINTLTDEYIRLAYHGMRTKNNSFNANIETNFDSSIGKINIVSPEIGRVIFNLLNNAFYAVNEKQKLNIAGYAPTITVSTGKGNGRVEIKVVDNGNGIPANIVDKIFQPFFTTKPTGEGTGLGLSLAYDIVTKGHGGELKVETKEKEGTTFIVQLPNP